MDYDLIVERSQESALRSWIANVRDEDVIRLAAKYRPGQPQCTVEQVLGGPRHSSGDEEDPVNYQDSSSKYHSLRNSEDNVGGFGPFMINEFVFGDNLAAKLFDNPDEDFEESIYRQIAGFLLELSGCRFDTIGFLSMDNHGDNYTWSVRTRPLTLAINETLRCGGVTLYDHSKPYTSTSQYFLEIAEQKLTHLLQQRNSIDNHEDAIKKLKRCRLFTWITPQFVSKELNNGPFTLVCEDFRPGNMLVRDGKIVAVFDWEWTHVGPLELLLSPPRWLCKGWPAVWDSDQRTGYDAKFKKFVGILQEEEMKIGKSGPPIMSKLMEESWNRSGKFEYHQLLGEVFLFDEDWLWERLEADYANQVQNPLDDTSIIKEKLADYSDYLATSGPMQVFDFLRGSKGSGKCSFCWAYLHPQWMRHDISECVQVPHDSSTVSVMEAAAICRSHFRYPDGLDIHSCGAPYYFGCNDKHCIYPMIAYPAYIAATGKASQLHQKARMVFSKRYDVDINKIPPEELMAVMARPHQVASSTVSALVWFIELIHDNAEASFQWYSQYGL